MADILQGTVRCTFGAPTDHAGQHVTKTHYDTVGAAPDATPVEVRKAYLRRARQLHPDQFVGRPDGERARAERRMQELNAAWTVLSDPSSRRAYDASLQRRRPQGTGPIVSGRGEAWQPFDPGRSAPRPRKPRPQVANERDMEIRGAARLLRPVPLVILFGSVSLLITLAAFFSGDPDAAEPDRAEPAAEPTGTPIGCIDLVPVAVPVPCGGHDAVVWELVEASEPCSEGLEAIYRQGEGGLFCVTRVG